MQASFSDLLHLGRRKPDIHLVELESIFFARTIRGDSLIPIQNVVDERRPLSCRQTPGPFDAAHRARSKKRLPGFEIPRLRFRVNTQYAKAIFLSQISVLLRRQVQIGIVKLPKVSAPSG